MNEYFSKKNIIKYLNDVSEVCMQNCEFEAHDNLIDIIREIENGEIKAEDVIPVVRCKDCAFYKTSDCMMYYECLICNAQYSWASDNSFCSYGKREDEEYEDYDTQEV